MPPELSLKLDEKLRNLGANHRSKLAEILDVAGAWKKLASILPKPVKNTGPLFSNAAIDQLDRQLLAGNSPTIELIRSWSTRRGLPTIRTLLFYLEKAEMQRATDYVCRYILGSVPIDETNQHNTGQSLGSYGRGKTRLYKISSSNTSTFETMTDEKLLDINSTDSKLMKSCDLPTENLDYSNDYLQTNSEHPDSIVAGENYDLGDIFAFDGFSDFPSDLGMKCQNFSFESIYRSTNKFCHKPYSFTTGTGTLLGEGTFSRVFKASAEPLPPFILEGYEKRFVAVKLLKKDCNKQFILNEVDLIMKFAHENILRFLGISVTTKLPASNKADGYYLCLVYEFMDNGSLLDRLACKNDSEPIKWQQRLSIAIGVAKGISYLHTAFETPIIHRDIKSANIFLDLQLNPKVGDFTLIRQLEANVVSKDSLNIDDDLNRYLQTQVTQMTQNIMGTSIYMAAEAFRGDISTKLDTFSFGVVLLEILTGMKPYDEEKREDIFTYITEEITDMDEQIESQCNYEESSFSHSIEPNRRPILIGEIEYQTNNLRMLQEKGRDNILKRILDLKAGEWDFSVARSLFRIALLSTEIKKKLRPKMTQVLSMLEGLKSGNK